MDQIYIKATSKEDLLNVQRLWADPEVMLYVGFPNGLHETIEHLENRWLLWVQHPPLRQHYSIYADGIGYCGESFYDVDDTGLACMDIKLLPCARGQGIAFKGLSHALNHVFTQTAAASAYVDPNPENTKAIRLYERLGFRCTDLAAHLEDPGCPSVYMELTRADWEQASWGSRA